MSAPTTLTYIASTCLVLALAVVPGLPLALALGAEGGWDLATVLAASFALELGVVGLVATAANYLGLTLGFVLVASLVLLLTPPLVLARDRLRLPHDLSPSAVALGALCLALGVSERTWFSRMADAFYHLAAVRSLDVTGRPLVTDPFFATPSLRLDATTGVWHTVLACWTRATGLDVATWLWTGATGVGAALTVVALWSLARELSGKAWAATLASAGWLVLVLSADVRWSAYPNRLSLAPAFVALAAVARLVERPDRRDAFLAVVAGFATIGMHLAAAEVLAAAGVLVLALLLLHAAVVHRREGARDWSRVEAVAGAAGVLAAVSVPLVLPKVGLVGRSPLLAFKAGELASGIVRLPAGLLVDSPGHLMQTGPLIFLVGTVTAVWALIRGVRFGRAKDILVAAIAGLPAALLLDPPVTTPLLRASYYLTERVAILLPFSAFVGLAWALALPGLRQRVRGALIASVCIALVAGAALAAVTHPDAWSPASPLSIANSRTADVRKAWGDEAISAMAVRFGGRYPIVASDPQTSYYLAGVMPVAVVAVTSQHTPFAFEATDGQQRRTDMERLMSPRTSEVDRRVILTRRHAEYVLVPKYRGGYGATLAQMKTERDLMRLAFETPALALFRVRSSEFDDPLPRVRSRL